MGGRGRETRHPFCMLCVLSLWLQVDTQKIPVQRTAVGNSQKCIILVLEYCSLLLAKAYLETSPAQDGMSLLFQLNLDVP